MTTKSENKDSFWQNNAVNVQKKLIANWSNKKQARNGSSRRGILHVVATDAINDFCQYNRFEKKTKSDASSRACLHAPTNKTLNYHRDFSGLWTNIFWLVFTKIISTCTEEQFELHEFFDRNALQSSKYWYLVVVPCLWWGIAKLAWFSHFFRKKTSHHNQSLVKHRGGVSQDEKNS